MARSLRRGEPEETPAYNWSASEAHLTEKKHIPNWVLGSSEVRVVAPICTAPPALHADRVLAGGDRARPEPPSQDSGLCPSGSRPLAQATVFSDEKFDRSAPGASAVKRRNRYGVDGTLDRLRRRAGFVVSAPERMEDLDTAQRSCCRFDCCGPGCASDRQFHLQALALRPEWPFTGHFSKAMLPPSDSVLKAPPGPSQAFTEGVP